MFTSAVIDVVIAVVLTFALTAVAASAVVESIGNLLRQRSKYLLRGLRAMLDAPAADKDLYELARDPTGKDIDDLRADPAGVPGGLTAILFDHPLLRSTVQPTRATPP